MFKYMSVEVESRVYREILNRSIEWCIAISKKRQSSDSFVKNKGGHALPVTYVDDADSVSRSIMIS